MSVFLYKNWDFWLLLRKLKSWELWVHAPSWEHGNIDLKLWGSPSLLTLSLPPHLLHPLISSLTQTLWALSLIYFLTLMSHKYSLQFFKNLDLLDGVPKTNMRSRLLNDVTINTAESVQASFNFAFWSYLPLKTCHTPFIWIDISFITIFKNTKDIHQISRQTVQFISLKCFVAFFFFRKK